MNDEILTRAEAYLRETYANSKYMQENPADHNYRLKHSYRVANIAKQIAQAEGFNVTYAVIAGLLHDISYCEVFNKQEDWTNHGRRSASMVRPFLEKLGIPSNDVNAICYGIAIHVDDKADFEWARTPFCESVSDADNIDRIDAYRIYEHLEFSRFSSMNLKEKKEIVTSILQKMQEYSKMTLATPTATKLWLQRVDFYIGFYNKLLAQLDASNEIL